MAGRTPASSTLGSTLDTPSDNDYPATSEAEDEDEEDEAITPITHKLFCAWLGAPKTPDIAENMPMADW
eukprot:7862106-Alexandrium_andersonii.AAC.1